MKKLPRTLLILILIFILISSINLWIYIFVDFTCYLVTHFDPTLLKRAGAIFIMIICFTVIYDLYKKRFSLSITTTFIILNIISISYFLFLLWLIIWKSSWEDVIMNNRIIVIHRLWTLNELKELVDYYFDTWPRLSRFSSIDRDMVLTSVWENTRTAEEVGDRCIDYMFKEPWRRNGWELNPIITWVLYPEFFTEEGRRPLRGGPLKFKPK